MSLAKARGIAGWRRQKDPSSPAFDAFSHLLRKTAPPGSPGKVGSFRLFWGRGFKVTLVPERRRAPRGLDPARLFSPAAVIEEIGEVASVALMRRAGTLAPISQAEAAAGARTGTRL